MLPHRLVVLLLALLASTVSANWGHRTDLQAPPDEAVDVARVSFGHQLRLATLLDDLRWWLTDEQFILAEEQIIELLGTVGSEVASRVLGQCEAVRALEDEEAANFVPSAHVSEDNEGAVAVVAGDQVPIPISSQEAVEQLIAQEVLAVIAESDQEDDDETDTKAAASAVEQDEVPAPSADSSSSSVSGDNNPLQHNAKDCRVTVRDGQAVHFHPERSLEDILTPVADNKNVVLLGATSGYIDLLKNLICQFRKLNIENFVVAAFDAETRRWCLMNDIPVFAQYGHFAQSLGSGAERSLMSAANDKSKNLLHLSPDSFFSAADQTDKDGNNVLGKLHGDHTHQGKRKNYWAFATAGFRAATKLKSSAVSRVLEAGFHVLWTDVDTYFFENPWPVLLEVAKHADVVIQSDTQVKDGLSDSLNSGFYYVKSNPRTVASFRNILSHTRKHPMQSEQPAFHWVLCEQQECAPVDPHTDLLTLTAEQQQAVNDAEADPLSSLTLTGILDRQRFPNGAVYWGFEGVEKYSNSVDPWFEENPPVIVHDNWIKGLHWKIQRLQENRMWILEGANGDHCPYSG